MSRKAVSFSNVGFIIILLKFKVQGSKFNILLILNY